MQNASGLEGNANGARRRGAALRAATLGLCAFLVSSAPVFATPLASEQKSVDETCPAGRSLLTKQARLKALAKRMSARAHLNVLAIGSSSTRGIGASAPARTYPSRFEAALKTHFGADVTVTNAGVNGETADATLSRLEERIAAERFDLVVWQVGTNDAVKGGDEAAFRSFVERGVGLVKAKQMDLVLLDPQFFPTMSDPAGYERFVDVVEKVGEATNTPVLSRYRLMKQWGERSPQDLRSMLYTDGFHMSDRGYYCLADAMVKAVADLVAPPAPSRDDALPAIASAPRFYPQR